MLWMGQHGDQPEEGCGFEPQFDRGLAVWSLHVLPIPAEAFTDFFPQSKDMQVTGNS